jgi:aspartyl protease family protein
MGRNILIIMAAVGFLSVASGRIGAPDSSSNFETSKQYGSSIPSVTGSGDSDSESNSGSSYSSGSEISLERRPDGHFYADVEINGSSVNMMVDTGASGVALSRDAARSAGIATSIGMNEVIGEGAGGAVHGEQVQIERIRLGPVSMEGVSAVVLDGGQMSLLGQDFLSRFKSVEIKDDRMILR